MITDELLAKYIKNEATDVESAEVKQWINASDENRKLIARLTEYFIVPDKIIYPDFKSIKVESWSVVQTRIQEKQNRTIKFIPSGIGYRIAASVALLAFISISAFYIIQNFYRDKEFIAGNKVEVIQLQDGSTITLNKNSRLVVDHNFQREERQVTLMGEAYFEVAKDKEHPFIITTQNIKTTVVGTAFNVKEDSTGVAVVVDEGIVRVEERDSKESLLLHTQDGAEYHSGKLSGFKNQDLNITSWKTGVIRFRDASIDEALLFLSKHYGVSIKANELLMPLTLTVTLDNLTLDESLSIIRQTLSVRIEKHNDEYFLQPEP